MSFAVVALCRYRPISSGTSISLRTALTASKRTPSLAKNAKIVASHYKSTTRVPLRRWYCQKSSEKVEEISESVSSAIPKPTSTTMPKSIHHLQNPEKATSDIGDIQIGSDGVVIPSKKTPSAAAANFTARRPSMSQEEVLKRMKEIDSKSRSPKEDKESSHDGSRKKAAKLPQVIIYTHPTRELANIANAVACIASFPVHVWGFYSLQPHLVAPFFAGSLVWLWWHQRSMAGFVSRMVMLPGHQKVEITTLNFFGRAKTRTVSALALTSVLKRREVPKPLTTLEAQSAVGVSLATTEVTFLEVNELLVNVTNEAEAETIREGNKGTAFRTKYIIQPDSATAYRHDFFFRFIHEAGTNKPLDTTKDMFE